MESVLIKREPDTSLSNKETVTIKLEPQENVEAKLFIANCETCRTPIEPRLSPIKQEPCSPNEEKVKSEPNVDHFVNRNRPYNSHLISETKESRSPYSSHILTPSNQHFKRSRSLSSSSSNFSYKPRKLMNVNFNATHYYHTNYNNVNQRNGRRINFSKRPRWKKFKKWRRSNVNHLACNHISQEINNCTMKIEFKPERELRVVKMTSPHDKTPNKPLLKNNWKESPWSHAYSDHQLQMSNRLHPDKLHYSNNDDNNNNNDDNNNNNLNTSDQLSLRNSISDKPENSVMNIENVNNEESVQNINFSEDNEDSVEQNNDKVTEEEILNEEQLTMCVDGEEIATFLVIDEVNEMDQILTHDDEEVVKDVTEDEEEESFKLDIEVVEEIPCDDDIACVFSKLKEAHLCTKCFVQKRRKKKHFDGEIIILKKVERAENIPLIEI